MIKLRIIKKIILAETILAYSTTFDNAIGGVYKSTDVAMFKWHVPRYIKVIPINQGTACGFHCEQSKSETRIL